MSTFFRAILFIFVIIASWIEVLLSYPIISYNNRLKVYENVNYGWTKRKKVLFAATELDNMAEKEIITVRFINTISGNDIVTSAAIGENLLFVGDAAGVVLPRACRTGLCGSCTCELKVSGNYYI